ncbi:MAG: class I SAM-dependent rRNA methyltransferase [Acidobacteria bacterium]|nr:class I SAM-dependent rRNA methyltransferase [Acidobacteriota bacterium]
MPRPSPTLAAALARSFARRGVDITGVTTAYRLCDGAGDEVPGVYVDRYGPAAVFSVHDDAGLTRQAVSAAATDVLERLRPSGLEAVYVKPLARDRSRLGGRAPEESYSPSPRAGRPQPDALVVDEHGLRFEVRLYDGFSTGLFLEHRDHRFALARLGRARVLNLFAYTCGFSVPLVAAGAFVTNVDVSARYLDWGRRNHALNGLDGVRVRYARMDAMAYLAYAARHVEERFDLVVLDPPTFGAADRRRGVNSWKATRDYPELLAAAARVLSPGGLIFAATNSRDLAAPGMFRRMIAGAMGALHWEPLPSWPADVRERGRVAAAMFRPR